MKPDEIRALSDIELMCEVLKARGWNSETDAEMDIVIKSEERRDEDGVIWQKVFYPQSPAYSEPGDLERYAPNYVGDIGAAMKLVAERNYAIAPVLIGVVPTKSVGTRTGWVLYYQDGYRGPVMILARDVTLAGLARHICECYVYDLNEDK
jgi:hypothetical protein